MELNTDFPALLTGNNVSGKRVTEQQPNEPANPLTRESSASPAQFILNTEHAGE